MRSTTTTKTTRKTITTGKILTSQQRKAIKLLTQNSATARATVNRLQTLLTGFRSRAKKLGALSAAKSAKLSNGRKRH